MLGQAKGGKHQSCSNAFINRIFFPLPLVLVRNLFRQKMQRLVKILRNAKCIGALFHLDPNLSCLTTVKSRANKYFVFIVGGTCSGALLLLTALDLLEYSCLYSYVLKWAAPCQYPFKFALGQTHTNIHTASSRRAKAALLTQGESEQLCPWQLEQSWHPFTKYQGRLWTQWQISREGSIYNLDETPRLQPATRLSSVFPKTHFQW